MTDKTIAELCAPLSAKVMPIGYAYTVGGLDLTNEEAIKKQRHRDNSRHNVGKRTDRKRKAKK